MCKKRTIISKFPRIQILKECISKNFDPKDIIENSNFFVLIKNKKLLFTSLTLFEIWSNIF